MANAALSLPMEEIAAICRKYHVQELSLFGSALLADFRADSDIDFLVVFEPGARVGLLTLGGLRRRLSDVTGRRVDLVPKEGLKPLIRDEVLASSRLVYGAE
jgi:uncharacterized protein